MFMFLFYLHEKGGFSLCLCLGFDQRVVVDVCRGDDFFLNGFASAMIFFNGFFFFEWV